MSRILVIGPSGSGKSTFAKALAAKTGIPFVPTDSLYWDPAWNLASDDEVVSKLPLREAAWIIDNNFTNSRREVWDAADTIIWLRFPFLLTLGRLTKRNLSWCVFGRSTWNTRRMGVLRAFSGIRHLFRQHKRQRVEFPLFLEEQNSNRILIFGHPREAARWLSEPGSPPAP